VSLGLALGEGKALADILGARSAVTEGVHSATAVVDLAASLEVDMPISQAVAAIVTGKASVDEAILSLLTRPFKSET
jgi:glycerol-3-phosphate dehydrogenase (NAD(P)+)